MIENTAFVENRTRTSPVTRGTHSKFNAGIVTGPRFIDSPWLPSRARKSAIDVAIKPIERIPIKSRSATNALAKRKT
jgi:hypothetical protein